MRRLALPLLLLFSFAANGVPVLPPRSAEPLLRFAPSIGILYGSGFEGGAVSVFVDGVPAEVLEVTPELVRIRFSPLVNGQPRPLDSHADARVVVAGAGEATREDAFVFRDSTFVPGNRNLYLAPIVTTPKAGANGSLWGGELTIYNASPYPMTLFGPFNPPDILLPGFGPHVTVAPGHTAGAELSEHTESAGAFIQVLKAQDDTAAISLRVRDFSASATNWGTELPLVAEHESRTHVTLLDIPTDPRYRATLRVYHWSAAGGWPARVTVYVPDSPAPVATFELTATEGAFGLGEILVQPGYAQLDLLTPEVRAAGPRVRVEIDNLAAILSPPPPNIWAFVSVTNNETQQVTLMTPR